MANNYVVKRFALFSFFKTELFIPCTEINQSTQYKTIHILYFHIQVCPFHNLVSFADTIENPENKNVPLL